MSATDHPTHESLVADPLDQATAEHLDACARCRVERRLARDASSMDVFVVPGADEAHQAMDLVSSRMSLSFTGGRLPAGDEPDAEPDAVVPGQRIDHYEILERLGAGGMGEVFLARDTSLDRKVALKRLHRPAEADSADARRLVYEAKATARFSHPHIVTVFGVGEHMGRPYIVLEYLPGGTLRDMIAEGPLSVNRTIGIGRAIASALREAKRHGILHRDLKPDNVMLPRGGGLKVVDFGLAKRLPVESDGTLGPDAPSLLSPFELTSTDMGGLRGSPHYMAPEQWAAEPVTAAVDVWALGLILYEMLAGASPFRGATMSELCVQICGPSRIPALDRELPDDLAAIIDHCLHKQPADRPAIEDVHERLRQLVTDIS